VKILYLTPGIFDKGGISRYNRHQIGSLQNLCGPTSVVALSLLGPSNTKNDLETPFVVNWYGPSSHAGPREKLAFALAALRLSLVHKPHVIWCGHLHFTDLTQALARITGAVDVVQVYGREVWTPRARRPTGHLGLKRAKYVVSDCYATAAYIELNYRTREPVVVMWDPVDTERFSPARPALSILEKYQMPDPAAHFNIMTLGRISRAASYKGYARLLEVFAKLPPTSRLIYGGSGDLVPELMSRAQQLGVAERVTFTGSIDENDLPDVYRAAAAFCLVGDSGPARGEGIPLTPLEAGACGVPILVGDQDGSREAVEQGINGFSLNPFDLETIAARLGQLMADEAYRRKMGVAARRHVVKGHSIPVFNERMRQFLSGPTISRSAAGSEL